jgi:hypothetical protein
VNCLEDSKGQLICQLAFVVGSSQLSEGHASATRVYTSVKLRCCLQNLCNITLSGAKLVANKAAYGGCVAVQVGKHSAHCLVCLELALSPNGCYTETL